MISRDLPLIGHISIMLNYKWIMINNENVYILK